MGIRVIGVNFSEILLKGKEIECELAGNLNHLSSRYRGSTVLATKELYVTHMKQFMT